MSRPNELPDFPASQLFLRRLAYSLVHDEARAEDLVQDTWTAWIEHRPSGVAEPKAWLARVLRNRAFNLKRGEERRERRETFAGRPDPSAPEVDGTLEAQAKLIEALRALEEPYRSALVQRYYHDLAPKEIAERSGTPLNTIKARLARGLEKLRAAMDQRYRGDRKAWCHWLTVLGSAPPPPIMPQSSAPLTGVGGSASTLAWVGVVVTVVAAAVWRGSRAKAPDTSAPLPEASQARTSAPEIRRPRSGEREARSGEPSPRAPVDEEAPRAELRAPEEPEPVAPGVLGHAERASGARESFDWPQYGGRADHAGLHATNDTIDSPKVLWFVPGCAGQPTLRDGDLYTGGVTAGRIDPISGEIENVTLDLLLESLGIEGVSIGPDGELVGLEAGNGLEVLQEIAQSIEASQFDWSRLRFSVVAAPVVTESMVLVRSTDGRIIAYDRELRERRWSWDVDRYGVRREAVPLCLASDELLLAAGRYGMVALNVADGTEAWHAYRGARMVPASDGKRVYFGQYGEFVCLDLASGAELWRAGLEADFQFGWTTPVVTGGYVIAADRGNARDLDPHEIESDTGLLQHARLSVFDARDGQLLWRKTLEGFGVSKPGLGARGGQHVFVGCGDEVTPFDLATGRPDFARTIKTGSHPFGSPTVVGNSLVFGNLDGHLYVYDDRTGELRWSFRAPQGAQVHDFVHTGERVYVATSVGLFCIGDDEKQAPSDPGFVLEWDGEVTSPFAAAK